MKKQVVRALTGVMAVSTAVQPMIVLAEEPTPEVAKASLEGTSEAISPVENPNVGGQKDQKTQITIDDIGVIGSVSDTEGYSLVNKDGTLYGKSFDFSLAVTSLVPDVSVVYVECWNTSSGEALLNRQAVGGDGSVTFSLGNFSGLEFRYLLSDGTELRQSAAEVLSVLSGVNNFAVDTSAPVLESPSIEGGETYTTEGYNIGVYSYGDPVLVMPVHDTGSSGTSGIGLTEEGISVSCEGLESVSYEYDGSNIRIPVKQFAALAKDGATISVSLKDELGNTSSYSYKLAIKSKGISAVASDNVVIENGSIYVKDGTTADIAISGLDDWLIGSDESSALLLRDDFVDTVLSRDGSVSVGLKGGKYVIQVVDIFSELHTYSLVDLLEGVTSDTVKSDNESPVVTGVSYSAGSIQTIEGTNYLIAKGEGNDSLEFAVSDALSGVNWDSVSVSGAEGCLVSTLEGKISIDLGSLGVGSHTFTVSVSDRCGNVCEYDYSFFLYRSEPTYTGSISYESGSVIDGVTYVGREGAVVDFTDALSDSRVGYIVIYKDDLEVGRLTGNGSKSYTITESGNYSAKAFTVIGSEIDITISDFSGNLVVDAVAPVVDGAKFSGEVTTIDDVDYITGSGRVVVSASDVDSAVDVESWDVEGIDSEYYSVEDGNLIIDTDSMADGKYSIRVNVADVCGNRSANYVYNFTILHSNPVLEEGTIEAVDGYYVITDSGICFGPSGARVRVDFNEDSWKYSSVSLMKDGEIYKDSIDISNPIEITESGNYSLVVKLISGATVEYPFNSLECDGSDINTSSIVVDSTVPVISYNGFSGDSVEGSDGTVYFTSDGKYKVFIGDRESGVDASDVVVAGLPEGSYSVALEGNDLYCTIDTSKLLEGTTEFSISCTNRVNMPSSKEFSLFMVRETPAIEGSGISGDMYIRSGVTYSREGISFSISGIDAEGIASIKLYNGNSEVATLEGTNSFSIVEDGNYSVRVTDVVGNSVTYSLEDLFEDRLTSSFAIDTDIPVVDSVSFSGDTTVADGITYYVSDGEILVQLDDTESGLDLDTLRILGVSDYTTEESNGKLHVVIDSTNLSDGNTKINIAVADNLGNSLDYKFDVDMYRSAPVISGDSHSSVLFKDGITYFKDSISVAVKGNTNYKVKSVKVYKDQEEFADITENGSFEITESGNYSIRVVDLINDTYTYSLEDLFSDMSSDIVLDEDIPVFVSKDFDGERRPVDGTTYYLSDGNITFTVGDALSGIDKDSWKVSGVAGISSYISVSDDGTYISINTEGLPEGESMLYVSVSDMLGNTYTTAITSFMHRSFPEISGGEVSGVYVNRDGSSYISEPLELSLSGYDSYKVKSIQLVKDGNASNVVDGKFTIDSTGNYTVRVEDIVGDVKTYSLSDLFGELSSSIVLDVDAPVFGNTSFSGEIISEGGVDYYMENGNIVFTVTESLVGINPESWEVTGTKDFTVSEDGLSITIPTENIPEGTFSLSVSVADRLGNSSSSSLSAYMFREEPTISGNSFSNVVYRNGVTYNNSNIQVSLKGVENEKITDVYIVRDGSIVGSAPEGVFEIDQSGEWSVRVVDLVGREYNYRLENLFSEGISSDIVIDRSAPSVGLSVDDSEISNAWVTGNGELSVDFMDDIELLSAVVSVNGETFNYELSGTSSNAVVSLKNDVQRASDGIYRVDVTVSDLAGNTYRLNTVMVHADFDAPEFRDLSASGYYLEDSETGYVYLRGILRVAGSTADIGSGVERVELFRDGELVANSLPVSITESGNYSLKVTDRSGLSSTVNINSIINTTSNDIIVDNDNPVISEVSGFTPDSNSGGVNWYKSAPELVYNVSDENIRSVVISVNGEEYLRESRTGTFTVDLSEYSRDTEVSIYTVDRIGNESKRDFSLYIDSAAPNITNAAIDTESVYKDGRLFFLSNPTLSFRAEDTGIGVSEYRLSGDREETNTSGEFTVGTGSYYIEIVDYLGNTTGVIPVSELLGLDSNVFVVDEENPSINVTKPDARYNNWYAEDVIWNVNLGDNVGLDTWSISINGTVVSEGVESKGDVRSKSIDVSTASVPVSSNGMYEIRVSTTDNAGNSSSWSDIIYVDRDAPTVDRFVFTGDGYYEGAESNGSGRYGFFFDGAASCEIHVSDGSVSAGLGVLHVTLEEVDGTTSEYDVEINNGTARVEIPNNFKGYVSAYATDLVGHDGEYNGPDGVITEDSNFHMNSLDLRITLPETKYRDGSGNQLYPSDTSATASIGCDMSGIRNITWGIGNETFGSVDVDSNGNATGDVGSVVSSDRNIVLDVSKALSMTGNANGLELWLRVEDRAGHISETSSVFSIDKDNPEISVSYDVVEEDRYYATTRVATVTVNERNFDPSRFIVEGSSGVLGSWSNSGGVWTNTITFADDGDYDFSLSCVDLAGNSSNVYSSGLFTIDKTAPVMSVSWDRANPSNGDYFNSSRTATVTVTEHNFDPSLFTLEGDGTLSGWVSSGDRHTATVSFTEDGSYSFSISGRDLAGNESNVYESGVFNIDATMPELEVSGVEQGVSYKKDVGFSIKMSDNNIDTSRTYVSLVGKNNGNIRINGTLNSTTGTYEFTNFPEEELYDDVYTLNAVVVDLAGNTNEQEIVFSVNRFGSSYEFIDSDLLNSYMNTASDVVITETNVDRLDMSKARVVVSLNGTELEIPEDYIIIEESESEDGKYIYTYTVSKEAFKEDGMYLVQIYSHAEEGTDYNSLSQEYGFILDTTKPEIIISGVESDEAYTDYERTVTVDIRDMSGISSIAITLNGEPVDYVLSGGVYVFTVSQSESPQNIEVSVVDMAGNENTSSIENFIISPEATVYVVNQNWFRWAIGGLGAVLALIIALLFKRRHDKKQQEEENMREHETLYKTSSGSAGSSSSSASTNKDAVEELDDATSEAETRDMQDDDEATRDMSEDKAVDLDPDGSKK